MGRMAEVPGFDSRYDQEIFRYSRVSIPALELIQPPDQLISGAPSPEVKRPGRESDHLYYVVKK
jgi:hypothetical protein